MKLFLSFIQNLVSFAIYGPFFFQICIYCRLHVVCWCQWLRCSNLFKSPFLIMTSSSPLIFFGVICEVMLAGTLWVFFLAFRIHFNHYLFIRMLCNMSVDHLQVWRQTPTVAHLPWVVWSRTLRTSSLRLRVVPLRQSKLCNRLRHILYRLMIVIEVHTIIDSWSFLLNLLLSKLYSLSIFLILRC
jgi:hypothetical protein